MRSIPAVVTTFLELLPALQAKRLQSKEHGAADDDVPRTPGRRLPAAGRTRTGDEERVRGYRARTPRNLRALRDRAGDGHEPRRRGHDGADHRQVEQPRAVFVRGAVPPRRGDRHAALPVRHGHGCRHHSAGRAAQRRGPDRLGGAESAAARQRAAERGLRGGRARRSQARRCNPRWSARCSSTRSSSARCRSTTSSRHSSATITAGCSTACRSRQPR